MEERVSVTWESVKMSRRKREMKNRVNKKKKEKRESKIQRTDRRENIPQESCAH